MEKESNKGCFHRSSLFDIICCPIDYYHIPKMSAKFIGYMSVALYLHMCQSHQRFHVGNSVDDSHWWCTHSFQEGVFRAVVDSKLQDPGGVPR